MLTDDLNITSTLIFLGKKKIAASERVGKVFMQGTDLGALLVLASRGSCSFTRQRGPAARDGHQPPAPPQWDPEPERVPADPDGDPSAVTPGCQLLMQLWAKRLTQSGSPQEDQILPQPFN